MQLPAPPTPPAPSPVPPVRPAPSVAALAKRYRMLQTLKSGAGKATFLARDITDSDVLVVVKAFDLDLVSAAARERFAHETRVLATLSGLGLGRLHDAGQTEQLLYFAQEYVPGATLESVLASGPLSVATAVRIGIELGTALETAHGAQILHRDVKPANILITGFDRAADTVDAATLIDFGLARSPLLDDSVRGDLVGTVRYLAPEAAGSLTVPVDHRCDLYSLGVVLFECLAGRPPFLGPTVSDLLHQHLSATPPDLQATTATPIPRALAAVIARLLRKEPGERYQSAAALVTDLEQIRDALQRGDGNPGIVIGRTDRRSTLTDPGFVGRELELTALVAGTRKVARGASRLMLLEADSGGGKSRLLDELVAQTGDARINVLRGQGVALSGQRPFALLHGIAEDLARLLRADEPRRRALTDALADVAAEIVRALPALGPVLEAEPGPDAGPEQFGELRSLAALRRLLVTLADEQHPVLLVLDDCQWSDALTVRLLGELFDGVDRPPPYLGVVAAFRSEEVAPDHPLRGIAATRLRLGPFAPEAIALLAESMAGPLPDDALDTVIRLADGNPFMAAAVLRGLAESGAMLPGSAGWEVERGRLSDAQTARRAAAFLVRRLELLDPPTLRLLTVGAVLGKRFDVARAAAVAGADIATGVASGLVAEAAAEVIEDARQRRLVWFDRDTDRDRHICTFFHDKIRESLLARLPELERRRLHSRAADVLLGELHAGQVDRDEVVFDLAYHLDAAGRGPDALSFALAAAQLARSRYALDTAATYYEMASRAVGDAGADGERREIASGFGDVLMLQGSYPAAEEQFKLARSLADDNRDAADLDSRLGALAFKQGEIAKCKSYLHRALHMLGRRIPRRGLILALLWEVLVQAAHTVLPRQTTATRDPAKPQAALDRLAMQIYTRLAYMYWFSSGPIPCAWAHLRGMNLAERYPPSAELGQSWSEHAPVMTTLPWYSRGVRYAQRSLAVRRELGDVWGQGQSLNFTGVVQYAGSNYIAGLAALDEASRLLGRTGDRWEFNAGQWNRALCMLRMGRLADAARVARETYNAATALGDQSAAAISLSIWVRATDGQVGASLVQEFLERGIEDAQAHAELHLAHGLVHRQAGRLAEAADSLREAMRAVRGASLRQEYIAPIFPWHATVLRELAAQTPIYSPRQRASRVRRASRAARRARLWAFWYRNNMPHALREAGFVAALRGRPKRAARLVARSLDVARAQGAQHEAILTTLAMTELPGMFTPATVELERMAACAALDALRGAAIEEAPGVSQDTLSISDRFATMLDSAREITAAASPSALDAAVTAAATRLLRAERAELLPRTGPDDSSPSAASRTLLQRAVESGQPVVDMDTAGVDTNDSLVLSGVRCALAAPVVVNGETVSCLYVTHRQLGEVFGEAEVQLAEFVATLAGAAYEHLAGNETRFRSLVQSANDVITLVAADGIVSYQSPAVERVMGVPLPGIVGERVDRWIHRDDIDAFWAGVAAAKHTPDVRIEFRVRHADGRWRIIESAVADLIDEPSVGGIVLNSRDITDRKLAEQQLRDNNAELERVSRAKDTFLASMSHELRTPLNAIIGFTGTLLMRLPGPLTGDQERQLQIVERSGKHLLSIINDMLDLTKIEAGELRVEFGIVECVDVVHGVVQTLQPLADEKHLPLTLQLPETELPVLTDERALQQILINLVSNAIKFTDRGFVHVSLDRGLDGGARISVTDSGSGIGEQEREQIFDAFERGTNAARRSKEGTGLGLHISRRLAEMIDAAIAVHSELGVGSTFTVTVPARAGTAER